MTLNKPEIEDALMDSIGPPPRKITIELVDGTKLTGHVLTYHMKFDDAEPDQGDTFEFKVDDSEHPHVILDTLPLAVDRVAHVEVVA